METLSQRDPRWKNIRLGTSDKTIATHGCTITALAIILGTTPDLINHRLNEVNGYAQGNLVIWAKLEEAFPGIKIKRVWTYDNEDVKANVPNVLVEVDGKPIGGYRHWLVYIGNRKALDPWDGKEKSTADYPNPLSYCIIGGKWNKPSPQSDQQTELDKIRLERDRNWGWFAGLCDKLNVPRTYDIAEAEIEKLMSVEDSLRERDQIIALKEQEIQKMKEEVSSIQLELKKALDANTEAQKGIEDLKQVVSEYEKRAEEEETTMKRLGDRIEELKKVNPIESYSGFNLIVIGIKRILGR